MPFFQDVDAKLTLTRVATAPVLIAEIAKATGQRLEVSPVLSTEVLMVSVEDARPADVLAKLAVAATARWEPMEGGYRLVADGASRSVEASAERARRLQAMTESVRKRAEEAAKKKDESAEMAAAMGGMFGGGAGVDPFMPLLDLNILSNMRSGERIVFATNPNGAQRPLRGNVVPIVQSWIALHNKSAKAMAGSMDQMPEGMSGIMDGPIGERIKRMSRPVTGAPTKVLIVATRGGNPLMGILGAGVDVRLDVRAYGADGAVLLEQSGTLGTDMMSVFAEMAAKQKAPAGLGAQATEIKYSDDAKGLMALNGGGNPMMSGGFGRGTKLSPSLRDKLFNPNKFEPLALIPGEGLVALAKARRKPLVASIPDDAFPAIVGGGAPKTVEDVEESLKTGPMRLVPDASFLVVKAAEPESARTTRVDRGALARLMQAVDDHETPTLVEMATFAASAPAPSENRLETALVGTFVPSSMGTMSGMVSWESLRLFAALSPAQRESLANGAHVPFGTLSPTAQDALRTLLYGAEDNLSVERAGASAGSDVFSMSMKMMMGGTTQDARDEPTEIAPRGLPMDGYLQAAVSTETIVRPIAADGPTYYSLGTEELAMLKLVSSSGLPGGAEEAMKLPDAGRLGTRTVWNLRGYVAPGASVGSTLTDDRTPKNGQTVSLNALPADLQATIAKRTEALKNSPLGKIMAMGATFGKPAVQP